MIMDFAKPIEHFNLQQKDMIIMNTLYVVINVSIKSNVAYVMLSNGDKYSNFSVANLHESSTQQVSGRINKKVYMNDHCYKALQNLAQIRFFAVQNLIKRKATIHECAIHEVLYDTARKDIQ